MSLEGSHDEFPAYEGIVNGQLLHDTYPNPGATPLSLIHNLTMKKKSITIK